MSETPELLIDCQLLGVWLEGGVAVYRGLGATCLNVCPSACCSLVASRSMNLTNNYAKQPAVRLRLAKTALTHASELAPCHAPNSKAVAIQCQWHMCVWQLMDVPCFVCGATNRIIDPNFKASTAKMQPLAKVCACVCVCVPLATHSNCSWQFVCFFIRL